MPATQTVDLIRIFLAVADAKSFTVAASRLRMPKSSVSRRTARLEEELGVELFHRTTHEVALSPGGEALLARVATPFAALKESLTGLPGQSAEPSGRLRIAAPEDFGVTVLPGAITSYAAGHPKVQIEAVLDSRPVDLIREGFDLAVRAHRQPLKDSSMQIRRLAPIHFGFYASPAYLEQRGVPKKLGDPKHVWVGTRTRSSEVAPVLEPTVMSDDFLFARELIRAGAGVGLLPGFVAACDFSSGKLLKVLGRTQVKPAGLAILLPRTRQIPASVLTFRDHLVKYMASNPLTT